jgi:nitrite reductase (NADH) small subunit
MSAPVPVCRLDDIPVGEGRAFAVEGRQVAVFRLRDGSLRALDAVCPHRGGPLADGLVDGRVVMCPLHSYTYELATGREVASGGEPVRTHAVSVAPDGRVEVAVTAA